MTDDRRAPRRQVEGALKDEMEALFRVFAAELKAITDRFVAQSEELADEIDAASRRLHKAMQVRIRSAQRGGVDFPGSLPRPVIVSAGNKLDRMPRSPGRRRGPERRFPKHPDAGGVPVEPNRPNHLSGGAAAALEFDRD
jgi:hypothetical protein